MGERTNPWRSFDIGSRRELLAALAPFVLLGAGMTLLSYLGVFQVLPGWIQGVVAILLFLLIFAMVLLGIYQHLPRWFLVYLGVPLPLFSAYIFPMVLDGWFMSRFNPEANWVINTFYYAAYLWLGLLVAEALILLLAVLFSPVSQFYRRLRRDWTLLSFLMYGSNLLMILFSFDDYRGEDLYQIAAMLLLAGGVWGYLRAIGTRGRFLSLFAGLTLAMLVVTLAHLLIPAGPDWTNPRQFLSSREAMSVYTLYGWQILVLAAPALINWFPELGEKEGDDSAPAGSAGQPG